MAPHLTADQKQEIEKLYLAGMKAGEIARRMNRKAASVRQHLYRAGLTKQGEQIAEVKKQSVAETLAKVRQQTVDDFEDVLSDIAASLKIDAKRLRDGWDELVENAADASALMRSKLLLLARVLRVYGLDKADSGPDIAAMGINFFVLRTPPMCVDPVDAAKPVETIPLKEARNDL